MKYKSKGVFLIIFMIVGFCGQLPAEFGFKGGLAIVNTEFITPDFPEINWNSYKRLQAGVFFTINLSDFLSFQPEIMYVTKGAGFTETQSIEDLVEASLDVQLKMEYVEVPILLKISFPVGGGVRPGIFGGPYIAYNIKASVLTAVEVVAAGVVIGNDETEVDLEDVEHLDYGFVLGGCLEFNMGAATVVLDARYTKGLRNLLEGIGTDETVKNQTVVFMVGLGF